MNESLAATPLEGRRILVTRAVHQAGKLSDGLRVLGAEPAEIPVIEIQPPEDSGPLDAALRSLDTYNWLIVTSTNTVKSLAERAAHLGIALDRVALPRIAAIGASTAAALRKLGMEVAVVPESYVAESLAGRLKGEVAGRRVLLARAAVARDVIVDALREAGAEVEIVEAYRNVLPDSAPDILRRALAGQRIDAAAFASSSSATHLAEAARRAGIPFPFAGVRAISIGLITSQTLRELGWEPAAEANPSDIPGLIAAVVQALRP